MVEMYGIRSAEIASPTQSCVFSRLPDSRPLFLLRQSARYVSEIFVHHIHRETCRMEAKLGWRDSSAASPKHSLPLWSTIGARELNAHPLLRGIADEILYHRRKRLIEITISQTR
jgi:hypothetical protein